jgi:hypothetical protein
LELTTEAIKAFRERVIASGREGFKTPGSDNFKGKDIIILAMGPSRGYCPFDTETWSVNQGYYQIAEIGGRLDKIFLAHSQVLAQGIKPLFNWDEMNELTQRGVEVINTHRVKGLKSKLYPKKAIVNRFRIDYFSDTICYMIAYALYTNTKVVNGKVELTNPLRLRFYGVDIQDLHEYGYEKPGIEFWMGYAMGLGAEITNSFGSTLLSTVNGLPYGVEVPFSEYDPYGLLNITKEEYARTQAGD